ncbi:MAG: T9SS type A sorting domain-containing protein [Saprospiraceae bacterium]|nr:T9SS type A sorting domain-containing protein [Saprospiraceae bacterium]
MNTKVLFKAFLFAFLLTFTSFTSANDITTESWTELKTNKLEKLSNTNDVNPTSNLYSEGDAADPYNESDTVGNWEYGYTITEEDLFFQSVPGGTTGLYSLMAESKDANWGRMIMKFKGLDPTKAYNISWDAKSDDGFGADGSGFLLIEGGAQVEAFNASTKWNNFSVCIAPTNNVLVLKIYPTEGKQKGEQFYIDNLIVVEVDECECDSPEEDADCDGVPSKIDCDDNDPNVTSTNENDEDCDGVPTDIDCDDNDPTVTNTNEKDADCDGVPSDIDCDDYDPTVTTTNENDADCDGVPTDIDCDDHDPTVTSTNEKDADCDGVPSDIDCDDHDPTVTNTNENDADCDGVPTDIDCDDNDPLNTNSNVNDADCDGVPTDIDCDDNDPTVTTTNENDADCDGVPTDIDCDDNDPTVTNTNENDADCDGVPTDIDCDDNDPTVTTTNDMATLHCPDPITVQVDGCGIEVTYAAMVKFCDVVDKTADVTYSIPSGTYFEGGTTEVTAYYEDLSCTFTVTVEGSDTFSPDCTIIGTDQVNIHDDNTVIGSVCESPSIDIIPPFYANVVSSGSSPDIEVNDNETLVIHGQVFDKIVVRHGGTLIFTASNVFINELDVEKNTTIKFEECANVFINKNVRFEEFTTFNPEMNNVTLYVDDNVEVKKGSIINAHIYVNDNDIKAEGKLDAPTYMTGVFVGKKVEGRYDVTWEGNAYCEPCPIVIPDPIADCDCNGGMISVTFTYDGVLSDLSANVGSIEDNADGTFTLTNGGVRLDNNTEIQTASGLSEIHTSCSEEILGLTFSGGVTVVSYVDGDYTESTVENCPTAIDCECSGGIVSVTFDYSGELSSLDSNDDNAFFTNNLDGTFTIATFDGSKLSNPDIFIDGENVGEMHASCSDNLLGYVYGDITVIEYTDTEGNVSSIETCPVDPVPCECDGKVVKMSVVYHGPNGATITVGPDETGNNATTISNVQFNQIITVELGDVGNWWYWSVNGVVEASIHTSCSDDILGNINSTKSFFGDLGDFPDPEEGDNNGTFLVISQTDSNGNTCSIDYKDGASRMARDLIQEKVSSSDITDFVVKVWPNPTNSQFNVKVLSPNMINKVQIQVFDIRNRLILSDQFIGNTEYKFGKDLDSGLYFVKVYQADSIETFKLIKQ